MRRSPRVANFNLAWFISRQGHGNNYRIAHYLDPVPNLPAPTIGWTSYTHIWPQYYISSGNGVPVTTEDITRWVWDVNNNSNGTNATSTLPYAPPGYDSRVNASWPWPKDLVRAHQWYFRDMHGCTLSSGGFILTNMTLTLGPNVPDMADD